MVPDEERRRLLEFFSSGRSASKLTDRLNVILNELRHGNQKWRQPYMTLEMMLKERHDDGRDEGIAIGEKRGRAKGMAEGRTKGITEGKIETARNMLKDGLSSDLITKYTGISEQQMKGLL